MITVIKSAVWSVRWEINYLGQLLHPHIELIKRIQYLVAGLDEDFSLPGSYPRFAVR